MMGVKHTLQDLWNALPDKEQVRIYCLLSFERWKVGMDEVRIRPRGAVTQMYAMRWKRHNGVTTNVITKELLEQIVLVLDARG